MERELRDIDIRTVIPSLGSMWSGQPPYWAWMSEGVKRAVQDLDRLVLVGHSGSGARLHPTIQKLGARVAAAVYVDCQLPGLLGTSMRLSRQQARIARAVDGRISSAPERDEATHMLADAAVRSRFLAELEPDWPIEFVTEAVPNEGWPSCASAYVRLSSGYPESVAYATDHGWPLSSLTGDNHLLMLIDPDSVATELVRVAGDAIGRG